MFLKYIGTPTITEDTGFGPLSISTNDILQVSEIRGDELLNLYPGQFNIVTKVDTILADDSVTTAKILDANVTNAKLDDLAQGSIKVGGASDLVTDLDAKTDGQILVGDGTDLNSVAVSGDVTVTNAGVVAIGADKVLSSMISPIVKKVATVTFTTAELLQGNTTPKELVPAPAVGSYIVVDRITASVDYVSAAYATNTTLEFRYTDGSGTKVTADITGLLTATDDKIVTVGGIEAETVLTSNEAIVGLVATGNPITGDSDVKINIEYRVLSI